MNTTEFLQRVRQLAQLPADDEDWTDAEVLAEATQCLYERFAQAVSVLRSGYWLHRNVVEMTGGEAAYRMPPRAIVQGLEKIEYSIDSGVTWKTLHILTDVETRDYSNSSITAQPEHFSLESDCVVLYPTPSSAWQLRFSYYLRPSQLIATVDTGVVFGFNSDTELVVSGNPDDYLDSGGGTMDIVHTTGCNEVAVIEQEYTGIASLGLNLYEITLPAGTDISRIVAGQVVRFPDQTDQIPLPMEMTAALIARTAAVILDAKGDAQKADRLATKSDGIIKRVTDAALPRIKSKPFTWKTRNTYLRRRVGFGGFR